MRIPIFLDGLWDEFKKCKTNKKALERLHDKLSSLKFLDPACGCGNFLVMTYRELRLLELEVLLKMYAADGMGQPLYPVPASFWVRRLYLYVFYDRRGPFH